MEFEDIAKLIFFLVLVIGPGIGKILKRGTGGREPDETIPDGSPQPREKSLDERLREAIEMARRRAEEAARRESETIETPARREKVRAEAVQRPAPARRAPAEPYAPHIPPERRQTRPEPAAIPPRVPRQAASAIAALAAAKFEEPPEPSHRATADLTPVNDPWRQRRNLRAFLTRKEARRALLLAEILGPPRGIKGFPLPGRGPSA